MRQRRVVAAEFYEVENLVVNRQVRWVRRKFREERLPKHQNDI
jgi:hypothetical protein